MINGFYLVLVKLKVQFIERQLTDSILSFQFKCLMMRLDPSEEDSDDSMNGGRESPVGEGQLLDLEVNTTFLVPPFSLTVRLSSSIITMTTSMKFSSVFSLLLHVEVSLNCSSAKNDVILLVHQCYCFKFPTFYLVFYFRVILLLSPVINVPLNQEKLSKAEKHQLLDQPRGR